MNHLYIVDSQKAVSQLLAESLSTKNFDVVGTSVTLGDALTDILELKPNLVVMEMVLSDGIAAELIEAVRAVMPETRFLIFSDNKDAENIRSTLQAGAHGFVEKSADLSMFMSGLTIVADGGCFFGFNVTEVLRYVVRDGRESEQPRDILTDREREVLRMIAQGNSNKDIAAKLKLSVKTVDNHRGSMMKKLDLHNVASITRYAVEHRMVEINFAS